MLEAVTTDLVFTISLKRSTQNLQLSTSSPADYPIYWGNSGQSDPPTNKPRPTHCNAIDDRALPRHGSSKDGPLPSEADRKLGRRFKKSL
jgi:hypothetical protein